MEKPWPFSCAAAETNAPILIEQARRKKGASSMAAVGARVDLDAVSPVVSGSDGDDLITIDEALTRLAEKEPVRAELVKLRFFGGLTMPEAAAALGISLATAERYWVFARAWLCAELVDPE